MKDAKERAQELLGGLYPTEVDINDAVAVIERDREEVRAEERKACADRFMIKLEECIEPLPNKVEGIITGSDIERLYSAILFPEPIEPSEPEGIFIPANQWPSSNTTDADKIRFFDYWRTEVEARIAKEGI